MSALFIGKKPVYQSIKALPNCVKKLMTLYQVSRDLQKNVNKTQDLFKRRRQVYF